MNYISPSILWRAADMADGIPGKKNPFLLLNLIRKVHMGESDGVNQDIYLTRGRFLGELASFKKGQSEQIFTLE